LALQFSCVQLATLGPPIEILYALVAIVFAYDRAATVFEWLQKHSVVTGPGYSFRRARET